MKPDDDCKYLLSIANRLVNTYKEDPKIIDNVLAIIAKFSNLKTSYLNQTKISLQSSKELNIYIGNLHNTIMQNYTTLCDVYNTNSISVTKSTINSQSTMADFESIDIDAVLGNKK